MKKCLAVVFALALISFNSFAQDTVFGRPTHQLQFVDYTSLDSDGNVILAANPKILRWEAFTDELILKLKTGSTSFLPFSNSAASLAAKIPAFQAATRSGAIREIVPAFSVFNAGGYSFTQSDLESHRAAGLHGFYSVKFRSGMSSQEFLYWKNEFAKEVSSNPNSEIVSVTPSVVFKTFGHSYNDPLAAKQWQLSMIAKNEADHLVSREGLSRVYVFVLDTGVDLKHEDIDTSKNFFDYDATSDKDGGPDDLGHGTHVYTTACARTNNGKGIVGFAYGAKCGNIKTLLNGSGSWNIVAHAILVAASKAGQIRIGDPEARFVINMSLGGPGRNPAVEAAVNVALKAGIIIVAAAGNSAVNIDEIPFIPASLPGVIAVAATDNEDKLANFSNYGPQTVFVVAPGANIVAGVPKSNVPLSASSGYAILSGTSMAAPHVASDIALVLAERNYTPDQIRFNLVGSSDTLPWLTDRISGGRINLAAGLGAPKIPPSPPSDFKSFGQRHNAAFFAWTSPGDRDGRWITGAKIFFSEDEFNEEDIGVKNIKTVDVFAKRGLGEGSNFRLGSLEENKVFYAAIKLADTGGNYSNLSEVISFTTGESTIFSLRTFESGDTPDPGQWSVLPGPFDFLIKTFYGRNELLWHLSDRYPISKPYSWRYGNENTLDYATINPADSMVVSEIFDVRFTLGLSLQFNRFQQITSSVFDQDLFEVYVQPLDESNRGDIIFLKRFLSNENSVAEFDRVFIDLSRFESKKFRLIFRLLSQSGGRGFGVVFDDVEIRVDK